MKKLILASMLGLSACGGGGGGSGGIQVAPGSSDPQGLYMGTLTNTLSGTTDQFAGLIDANHEGVFIDLSNPAAFRLTNLDVSGNSFSASFRGYAGTGVVFQNGQAVETGSAQGTFVQQVSITGSASPAGGAANTFQANYQAVQYEIPASFTTIAGTYRFEEFVDTHSVVTTFQISTIGNITGSDTTGCTLSGTATIPDPSFNAYEFTVTTACGSATTQGTGLAFYTPASMHSPLTMGTDAFLTMEYDNGSNVAVFGEADQQ